ncbi:MAG: hypothetical protein DKINENOH_05631 [bacterium]|nr:hypothetical protein [bacterium]
MESYLPLRPYSFDWEEILNKGNKYVGLAKINSRAPLIFMVLYALFVVHFFFMSSENPNSSLMKKNESAKIDHTNKTAQFDSLSGDTLLTK